MHEFKKGVGILARELNVKVVPVYIQGAYEAWSRTQKYPRLSPIAVYFGAPCNVAELEKLGRELGVDESFSAIARGIKAKVEALSDAKGKNIL